MNTKVQCYWVTPSRPSEVGGKEESGVRASGESRKQEGKVGNSTNMARGLGVVMPQLWTLKKKFELRILMPSTVTSSLALFPHRHHCLDWVDLASPSSVELWCSTFIVH